MKKILKKFTPNKESLENNKMLRPLAGSLANPKIWHINRRGVAAGVAIGFFFGSLPIAGQMLLAAICAIAMRVNLPIAVAATWISNPLTMPFFYTANYYFGAWLLGRPSVKLSEIDWSLDGLLNLGGNILVPLYFGSVVVGALLFATSFVVVRLLWRLHIIKNYQERKIAKKTAKKIAKNQ